MDADDRQVGSYKVSLSVRADFTDFGCLWRATQETDFCQIVSFAYDTNNLAFNIDGSEEIRHRFVS